MWWERKQANQYADLVSSSGKKQQKLAEKQGADDFVCFLSMPYGPPNAIINGIKGSFVF